MGFRRLLQRALLVGAVPLAVLALLILTGHLPAFIGLLALGASLIASLLVARLWLSGFAELAVALREALGQSGVAHSLDLPRPQADPAILADAIRRLARGLAEQGGMVERLRQADAAILANLPDPLLVLAADRSVLRANASAHAMLGPDASGRAPDTAALLRHPVLAAALDQALENGQPAATELSLTVPQPRAFAARVVPLDPPLADGGCLLILLQDRSREAALERTRADFVANASHELRTPLASLIGFIETLRGPAAEDAAAQQRFLRIMAEQADRMRRLIDDLLNLSRIEMEEHQPPQGQADLALIARVEAEALAPLLAQRGTSISLDVPPEAWARPADATKLAQVMRNLLDNALRHGRDGGQIRVTIEPMAQQEAPRRAGYVLRVSDNGPGIAKHHLPRLTERFYRVDQGRSRQVGGTGLGLAITRHIIIHHRGRLNIESTEGVGTSVTIWLPAG